MSALAHVQLWCSLLLAELGKTAAAKVIESVECIEAMLPFTAPLHLEYLIVRPGWSEPLRYNFSGVPF